MADKKIVFVAFAIEDVRSRDYLKGDHPATQLGPGRDRGWGHPFAPLSGWPCVGEPAVP